MFITIPFFIVYCSQKVHAKKKMFYLPGTLVDLCQMYQNLIVSDKCCL